MSLVTTQNLSFSYGGRDILLPTNFEIAKGDKIGLIGPNGAGKSTLFKLMTGELEPVSGGIFKATGTVVGFVEQHACAGSNRNVYDEILSVYLPVMEVERELELLTREVEKNHGSDSEQIEKLSLLEEKYRDMGGLTYKAMAHSCLKGLGFTPSDESLPVTSLSGGQRTKLALGKLLLSEPDLMLLDEPTNHLDITSVEWLEDFLSKYKGSLIVVSHDRYFLDRTTTRTFEINNKKLYTGKGGYSVYMKNREQIIDTQRKEYEKAVQEIARIEKMIAQQITFGQERNYITIASKEKQIERIKAGMPDIPPSTNKSFKLKFECNLRSGDEVLICENLSKGYDSKLLFENVTFKMFRGDRIFLLGPNGCGKSTLLGQILNNIEKDSGLSRFGVNVSVGYFEQIQASLMTDNNILEEIYNRFPKMTVGEIRNKLGAFNFRDDEYEKKMKELSGGERARVALLILMLKKPNFLILDEPTNHLDIASREVLEEALLGYEGTILCVSHDRYFVNKLANGILCFEDTKVKMYDGNYEDYLARLNTVQATPEATVKKPNEYKLRKEKEANERKAKARIKKIEAEMDEKNLLLEQTAEKLSDPENASDYEKIIELTNLTEELTAALSELENEWLELNEQI